jgi:hypothetical protein
MRLMKLCRRMGGDSRGRGGIDGVKLDEKFSNKICFKPPSPPPHPPTHPLTLCTIICKEVDFSKKVLVWLKYSKIILLMMFFAS